MIYLLDTNAWIKILNPGESPVKERFRSLEPESIRLCSVVKAELYYGAYNGSKVRSNLFLLKNLFEIYDSYPFDDRAAKIYGQIRLSLFKSGKPIGPL